MAVLVAAALALLLPCAADAARSPTIELLESAPGRGAVLEAGQPLFLRFRYRSDVPIHILLNGSQRGEIVRGFSQDGEELFPAGRREATVWLAYPREVRIDQVDVRLWNANNARIAAASFPFSATWTEGNPVDAAARHGTKSWVAELTPGQRERMSAKLGAADEAGGFDPFDLIFLCVPGYFVLQAALTWRTSGGWRKASLLPAVLMIPILAYTVLAFAAQSNLWPLLLIFTAPLGFLYLVVFGLVLLLRNLARAA